MNGTTREVDAQRARWLRYRAGQGLTADAGDDFACGGLGRHTDSLDLRLLFLPADPEDDAVPLDREVLAWLKAMRQSPYGGQYPTRSGGTGSGARTGPWSCTTSIEMMPAGSGTWHCIDMAASRSA